MFTRARTGMSVRRRSIPRKRSFFWCASKDWSRRQPRKTLPSPSGPMTAPRLSRRRFPFFPSAPSPSRTYRHKQALCISKPDHYLAVNVAVDLSGGNVSGIKAKLASGDIDNDNYVGPADFGLFIGVYNSDASIPGSGYDPHLRFQRRRRRRRHRFRTAGRQLQSAGRPVKRGARNSA